MDTQLHSIHSTSTILGTTQTSNLLILVLELVIVCNLLIGMDVAIGEEDNLVLVVDILHTSITIRITAMVDKPTLVTLHSGIDDMIAIQLEEIATACIHAIVSIHH